MFLGLFILLLGAAALIPIELWIHRNLSGLSNTLAEHVYLPLARVVLLILFLYAVFPSPMLTHAVLIQTNSGQIPPPDWQALLNVLFIIGLLLPLMPETQHFGAWILPLQCLIGVWIFVSHFENFTGLQLSMSGDSHWLLMFAALIIASHFLIRWLSQGLSRSQGMDALTLYDAIVLCVQAPLVLLISRMLTVQA